MLGGLTQLSHQLPTSLGSGPTRALEEAEADPHAPGVPSPRLPGVSGATSGNQRALVLLPGAVQWPQVTTAVRKVVRVLRGRA